jgi:hypothetical protein
MRATKHSWLLGCLAGLMGAALLALAVDPWLAARHAAPRQAFQNLVGGLGMGPATRLSPDMTAFDPRLGAIIDADMSPVPGGGWMVGSAACSILPYRQSFVAGNASSPNGASRNGEHDAEIR